MNSSRPDLTYWLQEIKGALSDEMYEDPYKNMPMRPRVGEVVSTTATTPSTVAPYSEEYYTEAEAESVVDMCADNTRQICPNSPSSSLSLMDHESEITVSNHDSFVATTPLPVSIIQCTRVVPTPEGDNDMYDIESEVEAEVEKRDRSNSMYEETDSEETFSPDQPSHVNVLDFPERSVPSPLNLPPPDTNYNNFTSKECSLNSINQLQTIDTIDSMSRGKFVIENTPRSQSRSTYSYQHMNNSEFTTIPTPGAVKVFLPRQYSCPTFSPFQTSSFSPFTLNAGTIIKENKTLSILKDKDDMHKFFENNNKKNKKYIGGNNATFMPSAFLPFHLPIPTGSNALEKV